MESNEIHGNTMGGCERGQIKSNEILFNDVEYDRKFRALQSYLPFVDNLLLQSSGKIASDRLQSLQGMLKETKTKMKYDVMAKCESVLQSLMKKMEAAKNSKLGDSNPRVSPAHTSGITPPIQSGAKTAVTESVKSESENTSKQSTELAKSSVHWTNGHNEHAETRAPVLHENSASQSSDPRPENRSMVHTLKLAAARTARNAETTQNFSKRVPITWDDTSTVASKKSEIDKLKLAAARAARFAEPPQIPDNRKVTLVKDASRELVEVTVSQKKCSDISTLKLAAVRTTKQTDTLSIVSDGEPLISKQEEPNSLEMSRNKLKKLLPLNPKNVSEKEKSPPQFSSSKFDVDSPRNDWDFEAAPESVGQWNPSPPTQDTTTHSVDVGDIGGNVAHSMSSESDQNENCANEGNKTSSIASSPMGSYYSPIHGLVQRRISTGYDSPLSPDDSGSKAAEAKRRLRDKLSQEINMVHRVGTSKGGSLRGLAAKDGKVQNITTKELEKKTGHDIVKRAEKMVEIDMFSKEATTSSKTTGSEPSKESPKLLKGLYAPRYKSSQENASAKSGIVSSEHKPASRSSIDGSRSSDSGLKKSAARPENKDLTRHPKLPDSNTDTIGTPSKILSRMTTEEIKRAVHMNVRNLPSPPPISALVLESAKPVVNLQPEKVILNPAFNNAPPPIEPGFFSKSDVDLRREDPSGFLKGAQDVGFHQTNIPQNINNRDPRSTYMSRFDRDTPMSPDENIDNQHGKEVGPGPGPRHITYHLNNAPDGWKGNDSTGRLPSNTPIEEPYGNQYPHNRETQWMNGGRQQMQYPPGPNVHRTPAGEFQGPYYDERNYQQPFGDLKAPQGDERDRRLSRDGRDFRGPQFRARNAHQPMGNQFAPQIPQEHGRNANQFAIGGPFQAPGYQGGRNQQAMGDRHSFQDPARHMSSFQPGDSNRIRGPQYPVRNVHHPMGDQRDILPHDQGRNLNHLPMNETHGLQGGNYQGRNTYGPIHETHEQQMLRVQGGQPFSRSRDVPAPQSLGQISHPQNNERLNPSLIRPLLPTTQHHEMPHIQGVDRDPRNLREHSRPEMSRNDKFHWNQPLPPKPAAAPSENPQSQIPPNPVPIPNLSPATLEKGRPVNGPLSPIPSATPRVDQILANPDCIPFKPPRMLDPRSSSTSQRTVPPFKEGKDTVPSKEILSKEPQKSQSFPQQPAGSNKQRKPRNSSSENTHSKYNKERSKRGSWEVEARRREERRRSEDQSRSHKKHQDQDKTSSQKATNASELVSPLNSLYGSTIIQKTGVGYGIQKFKIPKLKKPDPPKPVELNVAMHVEPPASDVSVVAENQIVPEPAVILQAEEPSMEQKPKEKSELEQQPENQQPVGQKPKEQPNADRPHEEPLSLSAPSIVEAIVQKGNVNVNQLLENLTLLGNLKPNQLKKFQNILMNSSSSDDSDIDDSSVITKKKGSKFKSGSKKKKEEEEVMKSQEDAEVKDADTNSSVVTSNKIGAESEQLKPDVSEVQESSVPPRKLRGRKPGPLCTKRKERESSSDALEHPNDPVSTTETAPKPRITRNKRRNSLEILQADIKDMYISEGVLSASGRRICTLLKKDDALVVAAKELPKKSSDSLADEESDNQSATSKKNTPPSDSKKGTTLKKSAKSAVRSKRSGRYIKCLDTSFSSGIEGVSDADETAFEQTAENAFDTDEDRIESKQDKDLAENSGSDSHSSKARQRKRKGTKRRQTPKENILSTTATSSASDDDDDDEVKLPAKGTRKKNQKKTQETDSSIEFRSIDSTNMGQESVDYDSSPVRKKKYRPPKICDSSDSCVESVVSSVMTLTASEDLDEAQETKPLVINASSNAPATTTPVNLAAFVKLQKISESSLPPSPSFGSSDESSDLLPLTSFAGPKSRQVARRGRMGTRPMSRCSQSVGSRADRVSTEFDSSTASDAFPKAGTTGVSDDTHLVESISDIINRLSKDDEAKRGELDDSASDNTAVIMESNQETVSVNKNQKKKRKSNWAQGVIKKKRHVKSSSPESASPDNTKHSDATCNSQGDLASTPEKEVVAVKESPASSETTEAVLPSENIGSIQEVCPPPSVDQKVTTEVSDSAGLENNEILDRDAEEGPNTEPILNLDKTYYMHHNFKSRKYPCKLCSWSGTAIISHYALTHPDDETFISRLSEDAAEKSIAESQEKGYSSTEDADTLLQKSPKKNIKTFTCRMCFYKCTNYVQFYDHCCGHTGEYRYKCSQCAALVAGKGNLCAHYQYHHKDLRGAKEKYVELFPLPPRKFNGVFAYICTLCNFVQMCKPNIVRHMEVHHPNESDSMQAVFINMHVESDKKRIPLRKRNKSVGDTSTDGDSREETRNETEAGTNSPGGKETPTESVDLAAFLPTDESLGHADNALDNYCKDLIDDASVSTFASKLMPNDQNPLIDALLKRTENPSEGDGESAPHQTGQMPPEGILDNQMPAGSSLADEASQDSCLSDLAVAEDHLSSEPPVNSSELMDDIIKRLEQSTGEELSEVGDAFELPARVGLEGIEDPHQAIFVGPFEVRKVDNSPVYGCEVDSCYFSTVSAESFISHLKYNHEEETWDGMCQTCGTLVITEDGPKLATAFIHLLKCHLTSIGVECLEAQRQIDLHEQTSSQGDPWTTRNVSENISNEAPFSGIRLRPLSWLQANKDVDDDNESMCVIENVVSLAPQPQPLPPLIAKPLLPSLTTLSYLAENVDEDILKMSSSKPVGLRSPPKIMRSSPKPALSFKVPQRVSSVVQSRVPMTRAIPSRQALLADIGDNSTEDQDMKMQRPHVQSMQAKAGKDPTSYEQMLERAKLRHLFKCMSRSCSFSSNNGVEFGRHIVEHKEEKCCAYCMKTFLVDENRELIAHVQQEHGHCTFQCAYCFYRAVSPSYVVVHQNMSHTNKSISILLCLGSAEVDRPTIPLSKAVPSYVCAQSDCGETFLLTDQFMLHLQESHTDIHNYSCHLCSTVCFDARNFVAHYRIHSLHLYQCRYCVHGTSNEEVMHHHLCNVHPGRAPNVVMREIDDSCVDKPITLDSLKTINLGDKNVVSEELIVTLPMNEMVDDVVEGRLMIIEPEPSEGEESESDAMVIDTSDETVKLGEATPEEASVDKSAKVEETCTAPAEEPICVIDLDSDSDDNVVDLTGTAAEQSLRTLRSSPRKPMVEGETSETRPRAEKRPGGVKEEGGSKPRPTTSFEFGAITLEDLNETGLSGEKLFRCGFSRCESACETVEELREHLMVCDHSRNSHGLVCPHCERPMKNLAAFCEHTRLHSTCRYGCGLCVFRATSAKPVQAHLRARHRITVTKCIPLNPLKADPENDLFVVGPLRPDKRKNHLVSQIQSPDKKSRPKYVYQPDEGHLLPIGAIYPFIVTCATCSFTTKVRKNMERHLTLHKQDLSVPSQTPVNAVPCLETKEMMFDKMTNLAASSNLKAPDATNLYLTPEDVARLPKFVPEQQRYRCGEQNCTYNSCDENMLIHHLRALHRDEDYYNCPHCPPAEEETESAEIVSRILIEKLSLHLKMHDNRLYKCGYCFYYDHRRHIVERHVTEKHSDYKIHVNVVREPFGEGTPVVSVIPGEKEPAKELTPRFMWSCSRCEFESATRPEMVSHSEVEHGKKLQYECGMCHSRFQSKQSFDQHWAFKHPGLKEQLLFNYFKGKSKTAAVAEVPFDTRPLWSRENSAVKHIRGILFEDELDTQPQPAAPEPEPYVAPVVETPAEKEAMFMCSICESFKTKVKADMKIHLYKELKYFRYQCTLCDKKVFSLTAGKKHMSRAHSSSDANTALTLFEKDFETEQKVEEILGAQEELMSLDNTSNLVRPVRPPKTKVSTARSKESSAVQAKEAPISLPKRTEELDEPDDVHEQDMSAEMEIGEEDVDVESLSEQADETKTLECKECGQLFHTVRGLKIHIRLTHLAQGKWKCNSCEMTHMSRSVVENHSKSVHPNSTSNPATAINPAWTKSAGNLTAKYWKTTWGIDIKGERTGHKATEKTASKSVEVRGNFKCRHCSVQCITAEQRARHEELHPAPEPYSCGHCRFGAASEASVKEHSKEVHPRLPLLVESEVVPENQESKQRRKQKLKAKKSFDDSPLAAKRMRKAPLQVIELDSDSEDEKKDAPAAAATPAAAPAPIAPSLGEFRQHFKCHYCPMRSEMRPPVHAHWLKEHKEPRFTEDGFFYPNTGVTYQMDTIDGALSAFPCAECPKSFDTEAGLDAHAESQHPVVSDIPCPKCEFKTRIIDAMKEHLHRHKFDFKCTLCAESFISKKNASYHWEVMHPNDEFKDGSFVMNLDQYKFLRMLYRKSARIGKDLNVAKKSTTKVPRAGDFFARKSTGNSPWKRGISCSPKKATFPGYNLRDLSVKVLIGLAEVDMRVDTYADFFNIYPKVNLVNCMNDPEMNKYFLPS